MTDTHKNAPHALPESADNTPEQGQQDDWPLLLQAESLAQQAVAHLIVDGKPTFTQKTRDELPNMKKLADRADELRQENLQRTIRAKTVLAKYPQSIILEAVAAARDHYKRYAADPDRLCEVWERAQKDALTRFNPPAGWH